MWMSQTPRPWVKPNKPKNFDKMVSNDSLKHSVTTAFSSHHQRGSLMQYIGVDAGNYSLRLCRVQLEVSLGLSPWRLENPLEEDD